MTLLGKSYISEETTENKGYTLPVIVSKKHDEISMGKSLFISILLHPATVFVGWLVVIILAFWGFNINLWSRPTPVNRDIEFVLVNKEDTPINKNTPYRADINSRAGGKHNPKKPVSMPSPEPAKPAKKAVSSPASDLQKMIKQQQKQVAQQAAKQPAKQQQTQTTAKTNNISAPLPQKVAQQPKQIDAPKAIAPRPSSTPNAPKLAQVPKSNFQVPTPKVAAPKVGVAQGGPVAGTSEGTRVASSGGSSGTGKGSAAPSFAPAKNAYGSSGGTSSGTGGQGRFSNGSGAGGYGSAGNPGPGGNPNGRPGIDAVKDVDFGPYMKELQRRIKMNWDPPKGNESKRVILLFSISKDGRLLNVKVAKTSGVPAADRAAINAVQLTAPFKPLPSDFRGQKVDIQFTFDYNVFGANSYY